MTRETIARYEIESELGRGGMATVYLAYDPNFHRNVAIKLVSIDHQEKDVFRERFEREARLIARIEHPAVVPVYDFGEIENQRYLVMRYMPGGTLAARIKGGTLTFEETARIISQIAPALDAVHAQGIVHRDLKPANILFDNFGNPAISDFGIAHLTAATVDLTGSAVIGTPSYMSPEQVRGDGELDGRSDVYALGVILFEMLAGRGPFHAATPMSVALKHLTEPIPSVRAARPDLPVGVEQILNRAMAKDPGSRYASASELARELEASVGTFQEEGPHLSGSSAVARREAVPTEVDMEENSVLASDATPLPAAPASQPPGLHSTRAPRTSAAASGGSSRGSLRLAALAALALLVLIVCGSVGLFGTWAGLGLPGLRRAQSPSAPATGAMPTQPGGTDETLLYEDDFSDPNRGWPAFETTEAAYTYEADGYHIAAYGKGSAPWAKTSRRDDDAAISVDARPVTQGTNGYYGVLCRIVDDQNFYYFAVQATGQYAIGKYKNAEFLPLEGWRESEAIHHDGQPNRLTAECVGSTLRFYANDVLLAEVTDSDFTAGFSGLIVSVLDTGNFEAAFRNFRLTEAGR